MRILSRLALYAAATALSGTALAAPSPAPAPLSSLISQVNIPYQMFKLKNGLTVIVHEDHKAPVESTERRARYASVERSES